MTTHTILLAFEVDEQYTAANVKAEIEHFLPFLDSELFNTISAMYPARIKSQVKTYQVWCVEHVDTIAGVRVNNHAELVALEESTGYGYSSIVTTDDIEAFVTAVQNEFNGDLEYHLVETD